MRKKETKTNIDYSQIDLTKVPLSELNSVAKHCSLSQIVSAMCKLFKKMGLIKDEDENKEQTNKVNTLGKSFLEKTSKDKNFNVAKFIDSQDIPTTDKVLLNNKLSQIAEENENLDSKVESKKETTKDSVALDKEMEN